MRAIIFIAVALCAPVVLAVPHGGSHRHQHPARAAEDAEIDQTTVTDVVTVTANGAVVWVNQYKEVMYTEFHGEPASSTQVASSDPTLVVVPVTPTPVVPVTIPAGISTVVPVTSSSAAPATAAPVSSVDPPQSDTTPAPAEPTTEDNSTPAPAPTAAAETSAAPADDDARIANKGTHGGHGANVQNNNAGGGFGIDYELIGSNGCKPQSEMNTEFGFLSSQGYSKIRFYDIGCDLSVATAAAAAAGMTVTLGLNTIGNVNTDLQTLIGMVKGNWGPIDTIVIGNEVVNQGGSVGAVVAAVNAGRGILQSAGFTKNVVAVDTFMAHQQHPEICQCSDFCAVNAHAFFDPNTEASNAGSFVTKAISSIQTNGKAIIITESGWPWQGGANGAAVPSVANQQAAIASLKSAFASNPGGLFLFQAYDASYKSGGAFGVEPYFGIYGH